MDNTASPDLVESILDQQLIEVEPSSLLVAFHYSGKDNGVPKEGLDSRVIQAPAGVQVTSAEDVKSVADALANSEFMTGRKYEGLEITILHLTRLPI